MKTNTKFINWVLIQILKLRIKQTTKRMNKESNDIVKRAYKDAIKSFESCILFLSVL